MSVQVKSWRALKVEDENHHKKEIDALLRAAEEDDAIKPGHHFDEVVHPAGAGSQPQTEIKQSMDRNDDAIFDELLAAVPGTKTATDIHTPFNSERTENPVQNIQDSTAEQSRTVSTPVIHSNIPKNQMQTDEFDEPDDLLVENIETERTLWQLCPIFCICKSRYSDGLTDCSCSCIQVFQMKRNSVLLQIRMRSGMHGRVRQALLNQA